MRIGDNFELGEYCVFKNNSNNVIGNNCRISDFCRITAKITLGDYIEIASHVSICGGDGLITFEMKGYSSLSSGVRVWLSSNDYRNELVVHGLDNVIEITGPVIMDKFTGVGTNSVIMPNNYIPEGVTIGALSFIPSNFNFEPWTIYAGCPIRKVGVRHKAHVLRNLTNIKL